MLARRRARIVEAYASHPSLRSGPLRPRAGLHRRAAGPHGRFAAAIDVLVFSQGTFKPQGITRPEVRSLAVSTGARPAEGEKSEKGEKGKDDKKGGKERKEEKGEKGAPTGKPGEQ